MPVQNRVDLLIHTAGTWMFGHVAVLGYHSVFSSSGPGQLMLSSESKVERAKLVRELAEKTTDPFIKRRLLTLVSRYDDGVSIRAPLPP